MENDILQSIIEMTRQRDLDSLEYSLAATLAELVPAQRISLNKFMMIISSLRKSFIFSLIWIQKTSPVMNGIINPK